MSAVFSVLILFMATLTIAHKTYAAPSLRNVKGPILVTGSAGFIGFHTAKALLDLGFTVVGVDNLNPYYDVRIKEDRLAILKHYSTFSFYQEDLSHREAIEALFAKYRFAHLIHLAAQAGVRYSLTHPFSYLKSNIDAFLVLLEQARHEADFQHIVYASSSSVYGMNAMPFSEEDSVDLPMSLYAVTKRSNELMAQSYFHLYKIPITGLRFFTVYGPWGRPDMAAFKFVKAICAHEPIDVYNYGHMARDYTFVGDTVCGILGALATPPTPLAQSLQPKHPIFNLGNNKLETLSYFIEVLERHLGKKSVKNMMPIQPGDVPQTAADIKKAQTAFGYSPATSIDDGLKLFVDWYKEYYQPSH